MGAEVPQRASGGINFSDYGRSMMLRGPWLLNSSVAASLVLFTATTRAIGAAFLASLRFARLMQCNRGQ